MIKIRVLPAPSSPRACPLAQLQLLLVLLQHMKPTIWSYFVPLSPFFSSFLHWRVKQCLGSSAFKEYYVCQVYVC